MSISPELLFTNENGEAVALGNLQNIIEEGTGKTTVTGELLHFSFLLTTNRSVLDTKYGVLYWIQDLPNYLDVNKVVIVTAKFTQRGFFKNTDLKDATYKDLSSEPFKRNFSPSEQPLISEGDTDDRRNTGQFPYTCIDSGTGVYKSYASGIARIGSDDDPPIIYPFQVTLPIETNIQCVAPPELQSPVNSATGVELDIFLEWSDADADSYIIQVAEEGQEFEDPNSIVIITDSQTIRISELKPATTYRWRVRSRFPDFLDGNEEVVYETDWSEVWTFTTLFPSLFFSDPTTCVEPFNGKRYIIWEFPVETENIPEEDIDKTKVSMSVKLPVGANSISETRFFYPNYFYINHPVITPGTYLWNIDSVEFDGNEINFGGSTSGEVEVTDEDQNVGQCLPDE